MRQVIAATLLSVLAAITACRTLPDDPFFRLSLLEQKAMLTAGHPPEAALDIYLQAVAVYRPEPRQLTDALAQRGAELLPVLRERLGDESLSSLDVHYLVRLLSRMEHRHYYAVSADEEWMNFLESRADFLPDTRHRYRIIGHIERIRVHGRSGHVAETGGGNRDDLN
jgi:hypothetical protein